MHGKIKIRQMDINNIRLSAIISAVGLVSVKHFDPEGLHQLQNSVAT